jgi:hypothetical protein
MSKSGKKVDVWRPSIATQPFRAKIAAKGSHAELFQSPADRALQEKRFQSAVDRAVQETMRAKEIKREYSPKRSKGGRRRTLKRGGKYCKKYGGRKSKKCGCSLFSFR